MSDSQGEWRHRAFEAVLNFRDFGGYGCSDTELPRGRLFRSAHFARASDADIEALHALDVRVVVDLRSAGERSEQPSRRHPDFAARVIEATGEQGSAPHRAAASGALTSDDVRRHMIAAYRELPYRVGLIDAFSRTFEALAAGETPLLIHCAAGKDRTGLLAALIQHVAGVADAHIMADYLLTNRVEHPVERLEKFSSWLAGTYGATPDEAAVRTALGVEPVFLETAWASMNERNGDVDGYLRAVLGVDDDRRRRVFETLHA